MPSATTRARKLIFRGFQQPGASMTDWIPMFTLPNITLTEPIETDGVALVSTADPRLAEIAASHPAFQTYINSFKTEFGRSLAPSFVLAHEDAPPVFRGVEALAAFRDSVSMSVIPLSWAKSLRFGHGGMGIHYSNWFSIYPWMLDKNYEYLLSMTMATSGMDEVGRLRGFCVSDSVEIGSNMSVNWGLKRDVVEREFNEISAMRPASLTPTQLALGRVWA